MSRCTKDGALWDPVSEEVLSRFVLRVGDERRAYTWWPGVAWLLRMHTPVPTKVFNGIMKHVQILCDVNSCVMA